MPNRSLRRLERGRKLGRARRALAQECDDPSAEGIRESAELLGILDDQHVFELAADHAPYLSATDELVAALLTAA